MTDLPMLPDPWDYAYEWDGPYGTRKLSVAPHNGRPPTRTVPVYTAEQVRACIEADRAQRAEPASRALLSEARPVSLSLLRQALDALEHHREQTRPIAWTDETIAALRAEIRGAADAAGAKAQGEPT